MIWRLWRFKVNIVTEVPCAYSHDGLEDERFSLRNNNEIFIIFTPQSRLVPLDSKERSEIIHKSLLSGHYERLVDRESAYEKLKEKTEQERLQQQEIQPSTGRVTRYLLKTVFKRSVTLAAGSVLIFFSS